VYGLLQRRTQFNSKVFICCFNSHSSREKLKKANCRFIMCVQSLIPAAVPNSFFIKALAAPSPACAALPVSNA
jgi:hypothetical protein